MSQASKPAPRATVVTDAENGTIALVVNATAEPFASAKGNPILFTTKGRFVPFGPDLQIQVTVRPTKAQSAPESIGLTYG